MKVYSPLVYEGVFSPDFEISALEHKLFLEFETTLLLQSFKYLSLPVSVKTEVLYRQNVAKDQDAYWLDGSHFLNGSAEQGILSYFKDSAAKPQRIYSTTSCFRREYNLNGLSHLKEFKKLEQFSFCKPKDWEDEFELLLTNATNFLTKYDIKHRVRAVPKGEALKKLDIEIKTKDYGWLETHSCTYFGSSQMERLSIYGNCHTISNTGLASPRILIPFLERM